MFWSGENGVIVLLVNAGIKLIDRDNTVRTDFLDCNVEYPLYRTCFRYKMYILSDIMFYFCTLQRFQSKTLRSILNAPWYTNNHRIHEDLQMNTVLRNKKWNAKYLRQLENHTNVLAVNLLIPIDCKETPP
jgi:hypothetical protein